MPRTELRRRGRRPRAHPPAATTRADHGADAPRCSVTALRRDERRRISDQRSTAPDGRSISDVVLRNFRPLGRLLGCAIRRGTDLGGKPARRDLGALRQGDPPVPRSLRAGASHSLLRLIRAATPGVVAISLVVPPVGSAAEPFRAATSARSDQARPAWGFGLYDTARRRSLLAGMRSEAGADRPGHVQPVDRQNPSKAVRTATRYVSPSGNDARDGGSAAPWRTIAKAARAAPAGSTVSC